MRRNKCECSTSSENLDHPAWGPGAPGGVSAMAQISLGVIIKVRASGGFQLGRRSGHGQIIAPAD